MISSWSLLRNSDVAEDVEEPSGAQESPRRQHGNRG